jgi:hypothetical protein
MIQKCYYQKIQKFMGADPERKAQVKKSVQEIIEKTKARIEAGRDELEAYWQAVLESFILAAEDADPGQLHLMSDVGDKESLKFHMNVAEKLDLPPDTIAFVVAPELDMGTGTKSYRVIISGYRDHTTVIVATLPGLESVGIDVFQDGHHLVDYNYYTIEECLDDLSNVVWVFFEPKQNWTEEQMIRYTESWFIKNEFLDLNDVAFHKEYSYIHHPELIGTNPNEAIFKLLRSSIPKKYDSLDEMIKIFNEISSDMNSDVPPITKKGLVRGDLAQCQAFYDSIAFEMDMDIDTLEFIEGVSFDRGGEEYRAIFDQSAKELYENLTNCLLPEGAYTGWDKDIDEDSSGSFPF